mgnify:CR=1 FL=1|jgi:hypothetical protein
MAKDGKEYVAFVADRLIRYIETPADERRRLRRDARSRREPFLARWFGWPLYGWLMRRRARRIFGPVGAEEAAERTAEPVAEPAAES